MEDFAKRLDIAIKNKNIRLTELSKKTGLALSTICHYKKGDYKAKQDSLTLLAEALDTNEAWLMGFDVPNVTRKEMLRIAKEHESK